MLSFGWLPETMGLKECQHRNVFRAMLVMTSSRYWEKIKVVPVTVKPSKRSKKRKGRVGTFSLANSSLVISTSRSFGNTEFLRCRSHAVLSPLTARRGWVDTLSSKNLEFRSFHGEDKGGSTKGPNKTEFKHCFLHRIITIHTLPHLKWIRFPCVQVTSHWKCIRLVSMRSSLLLLGVQMELTFLKWVLQLTRHALM